MSRTLPRWMRVQARAGLARVTGAWLWPARIQRALAWTCSRPVLLIADRRSKGRTSGRLSCDPGRGSQPARMLAGWIGKIRRRVPGSHRPRALAAIIGLALGHAVRRVGALPAPVGTGKGSGRSRRRRRRAVFRDHVPRHGARREGRRPRFGSRRSTRRAAVMRRAALAEADRQRAIELFHRRQAADFPLERDARTPAPLRGQSARPVPPVRARSSCEAALAGQRPRRPPRAVFQRMAARSASRQLEFARARGDACACDAACYGRGPERAESQGPGRCAAPTRGWRDAYEVLGVTLRRTRDAEVTKAYRRLMSQQSSRTS